jgi:SPP1 family predicted phage head-tail adaptor
MNLNGKVSNPGELRTRITIEKRAVDEDAGGFPSAEWSTLAVVKAKWTNLHGSEVWAASAVQASAPATVLMRYRADVDATCALVKGGLRYEIVSLDNIQERGEYMELKVQRMRSG